MWCITLRAFVQAFTHIGSVEFEHNLAVENSSLREEKGRPKLAVLLAMS